MKIIDKIISDVRIDRRDELSIQTVKIVMEKIAKYAYFKGISDGSNFEDEDPITLFKDWLNEEL